ncbi:MAG: hypothetical protein JXA20_13715 [Spirochaetes bacterium]|nr:hypothetical protein [Spirochaetota bacterium]
MKITTDLSQVLSTRPQVQVPRSPQIAPIQQERTQVRIDQSISDRLTMERSLNDALSITQMSHTLLQKAMVVSSRLRSVAEQTIISGKTDSGELQTALAEIQGAMQQYGERVAAPPVQAIPQVQNGVERVIAAAGAVQAGAIPDARKLNEIDRQLSGDLRETGRTVEQLQGRLQTLARSLPEPASFNPANTVPETARMITENGTLALNVQGNISRDSAVRLIGG